MIYTLPEIVMVTKLQILWQKECVWFKYVALIWMDSYLISVLEYTIGIWAINIHWTNKQLKKKSIIHHKYLENWSSLGKEVLKGNSQYTCKFKY